MNPIVGELAGYPLYAFPVLLNVGIVAGLFLAGWLGARRGVAPAAILDAAIWVLPAGLLGARLAYAGAHWPEYEANPLTVLYFWEGGLSLLGAVTVGLLSAWLSLRASGLPIGVCLDVGAPGLALGQAIGRLGCLAAGCATGMTVGPGSGWPALALPDSTGLVAPRFPSQLVESAADLFLCALLIWLWSRRLPPGTVAATYFAGYGLLRAMAEPLRGDATPLGPVSVASLALWWSVLAATGGTIFLLRLLVARRRTGAAGAPPYGRDT